MPKPHPWFLSIEVLPGGFRKVGYVGEFLDEHGNYYEAYHTYYRRGNRLMARICSGELIEWFNWKGWSFEKISKEFEDLGDPYAEEWCRPESTLMQSVAAERVRQYKRRR